MTDELIPASMSDFVAAIGPSATMSVIRVFGGGRVYVPKTSNLEPSHPLVRLLGFPLAVKLSDAIGGEMREIATAAAVEVMVRNEEILRRYHAGTSVQQISAAFGLSRRTVWYVIRGAQDFTPDRAPA